MRSRLLGLCCSGGQGLAGHTDVKMCADAVESLGVTYRVSCTNVINYCWPGANALGNYLWYHMLALNTAQVVNDLFEIRLCHLDPTEATAIGNIDLRYLANAIR